MPACLYISVLTVVVMVMTALRICSPTMMKHGDGDGDDGIEDLLSYHDETKQSAHSYHGTKQKRVLDDRG